MTRAYSKSNLQTVGEHIIEPNEKYKNKQHNIHAHMIYTWYTYQLLMKKSIEVKWVREINEQKSIINWDNVL